MLTLGGYYYVVLLAALASLLLARNLQRSRWGRALVAVRESELELFDGESDETVAAATRWQR